MRISIAMTTYNGAKYLQEQLDSFLDQQRLPDELVVCDDGSSDETISILLRYSKKSPFPVRLFRNPSNLGYVKNFEKALSLCEGDLIFLSDQDDVWYPNKIAKMADYMETHSKVMVLQTDMFIGDENASPTKFTQLKNILALGQSADSYVSGCATAVKRCWLNVALPIPKAIGGHDNWIHRLAIALQARDLIEEPLQCYRRHGSNASNWRASRASALSPLDSLKAHGLRDTTDGWRNELTRVCATRDRLRDKASVLSPIHLSERLPLALQNLDRHARAIESRINLVQLPRWMRLPRALSMWSQGDYQHFTGWKSLGKDLIRP